MNTRRAVSNVESSVEKVLKKLLYYVKDFKQSRRLFTSLCLSQIVSG